MSGLAGPIIPIRLDPHQERHPSGSLRTGCMVRLSILPPHLPASGSEFCLGDNSKYGDRTSHLVIITHSLPPQRGAAAPQDGQEVGSNVHYGPRPRT